MIGDKIGIDTPTEANCWGGVTDFENELFEEFLIAVIGLSIGVLCSVSNQGSRVYHKIEGFSGFMVMKFVSNSKLIGRSPSFGLGISYSSCFCIFENSRKSSLFLKPFMSD